MGMFDSVNVKCPKCGTYNEIQSKAGDCTLTTHFLDDAPDVILRDIEGETVYCDCGLHFKIGVKGKLTGYIIIE